MPTQKAVVPFEFNKGYFQANVHRIEMEGGRVS